MNGYVALIVSAGLIASTVYVTSGSHGTISAAISAAEAPTEWEHGYKTDRVVATRYSNPSFGYSIGFDLPKNGYDADRADMYDWLSAHKVHVFQGGGAPYATNFALIEGVTDKESANKFLVEFLPKFDRWIKDNLR